MKSRCFASWPPSEPEWITLRLYNLLVSWPLLRAMDYDDAQIAAIYELVQTRTRIMNQLQAVVFCLALTDDFAERLCPCHPCPWKTLGYRSCRRSEMESATCHLLTRLRIAGQLCW